MNITTLNQSTPQRIRFQKYASVVLKLMYGASVLNEPISIENLQNGYAFFKSLPFKTLENNLNAELDIETSPTSAAVQGDTICNIVTWILSHYGVKLEQPEEECARFAEFMELFITYLARNSTSTFADIGGAIEALSKFDTYQRAYTFYDKNELKFYLKQVVNSFEDANDLISKVTMMELFKDPIKEDRDVVSKEDELAFEKFMKVMEEFAKFVEKNNLSLPPPSESSWDDYQKKRNKILGDFIKYLYPFDGNDIPTTLPMRKSPEDPLTRQKRIWMEMLRPLYEERIMINEEKAKNPVAYDEFKDKINVLKKEHEAEARAIKDTSLNINQLVSAVPPDTAPDGWDILFKMINGNLQKADLPLRLQKKEKTSNKEKKGGAMRSHLPPLQEYLDSLKMNIQQESKEGNISKLDELTPLAMKATILSGLYAQQEAQKTHDVIAKMTHAMENLTSHLQNGGMQQGGVGVPVIPDSPAKPSGPAGSPTPNQAAAKNLQDLDDVKKEIRGILDSLAAVRMKYENTFKNLVSASDVKKDQDILKNAQETLKNADEKEKYNVSPEEQEIAAKYKTLEDEGKTWIQEVERVAADVKSRMEKVLSMLLKIYATDPTNKYYIDTALEVKMIFEGDYNATGDTKMGLMSHLGSIVSTIKSEYDNAERVYKPIAISVKDRLELQKERIRAEQKVIAPWGRGGADEDSNTKIEKNPVTDEFKYIEEKLDGLLKKEIADLDTIFRRATNPVLATAVAEPSLFSILYNQYQDRRNKVGQFVAANELSKTMDANNLVPRKALAVNSLDKTVFVFVTLFMRLFALSLTSWLIQKNAVRKISWALAAFVGIYVVLFCLFVLVVNVDIYRMRLLFNYVNFHGNSGYVMTHIGMLLVFSVIIMLIIANVNLPIKGLNITTISEEDKTSLMYRLEVVTMILWLFLVILVVVM